MPRPKPKAHQTQYCSITALRDKLAEHVNAVHQNETPAVVITRSSQELAALVPPHLVGTPCVRFTNDDGKPDDWGPAAIHLVGERALMTYIASEVGWISLAGGREGGDIVLVGYQNGARDQHADGEWIRLSFLASDVHTLLADPQVRELVGTWKGTWTEPKPGKHGGVCYLPREAFTQKSPPMAAPATANAPSDASPPSRRRQGTLLWMDEDGARVQPPDSTCTMRWDGARAWILDYGADNGSGRMLRVVLKGSPAADGTIQLRGDQDGYLIVLVGRFNAQGDAFEGTWKDGLEHGRFRLELDDADPA